MAVTRGNPTIAVRGATLTGEPVRDMQEQARGLLGPTLALSWTGGEKIEAAPPGG